ncbi:unnamed protein product [Rotaria sp. Silwood1]|nr:unnamed protein product [Rotaria sp. Silwood1]
MQKKHSAWETFTCWFTGEESSKKTRSKPVHQIFQQIAEWMIKPSHSSKTAEHLKSDIVSQLAHDTRKKDDKMLSNFNSHHFIATLKDNDQKQAISDIQNEFLDELGKIISASKTNSIGVQLDIYRASYNPIFDAERHLQRLSGVYNTLIQVKSNDMNQLFRLSDLFTSCALDEYGKWSDYILHVEWGSSKPYGVLSAALTQGNDDVILIDSNNQIFCIDLSQEGQANVRSITIRDINDDPKQPKSSISTKYFAVQTVGDPPVFFFQEKHSVDIVDFNFARISCLEISNARLEYHMQVFTDFVDTYCLLLNSDNKKCSFSYTKLSF